MLIHKKPAPLHPVGDIPGQGHKSRLFEFALSDPGDPGRKVNILKMQGQDFSPPACLSGKGPEASFHALPGVEKPAQR